MLDFFGNSSEKSFVNFEDKSFSFEQLKQEAYSLSFPESFNDQKYIAIISPNNYSFIKSIFALWNQGLIPVPINYNLKSSQISEMLKSINCTAALIDKDFIHDFKDICNTIIKIEKLESGNYFESKSKNEIAVILFTSGSTNIPKAVPLTFSNFHSHFNSVKKEFNLSYKDIWLASLPFYHIGGFAILIRALLSNSQLSLNNGFGINEIILAINKFDPSHISLVPTQLYEIVKGNISANRNHKVLFLGGGPADTSIIKYSIKLGWNVVRVYGSTETCSMISSVMIKKFPAKIESSGKPFIENYISVVDDKYKELPNNSIGEIVVKSNAASLEYLNAETLQFSNNKFFTRDYGFLDEDGFLNIVMRREDLIVSGGENVNPIEIENEIKKLNHVEDCIVIGVEDKKWGQKVCAVIQSSKVILLSEIQVDLKEKLASFKIPKEIIVLKTIPKNEIGKVNHSDLKKLFVKS